jgi:probable HAF family extracellular repeat protein
MGTMRGGTACLLAACCLLALNAFATTQYSITNLEAPCSYPHPLYAAIGDGGHVVGEWCVGGYSRGYIWYSGATTDLGDLGGGACFPMAVNASGQVTGKSHIDYDTVNAFRWDGGVLTPLGTLPGATTDSSAGLGINASGVVAGCSYDSAGRIRACKWVGTTITDIGTLGGAEALARGITALGEIVGKADVASGAEHAFLYLPVAAYGLSAGMNDLGAFGGESSKALGVNNAGQVFGGRVNMSGYWEPWVWQNGTTTYLGGLGGTYTTPVDINNLGQVVGGSGTASDDWHAFLWASGSIVDLNDCIAPGSGWVLETACGINDSGWIVGYGTYNGETRCFLLTPIPEPATLALAGMGLLALLLRRRR